jgi:hypothetical protein
MKKNFEYKEPEFKVVATNNEDVITTSGLPEGTLSSVTRLRSWDTATWGDFGSFAL